MKGPHMAIESIEDFREKIKSGGYEEHYYLFQAFAEHLAQLVANGPGAKPIEGHGPELVKHEIRYVIVLPGGDRLTMVGEFKQPIHLKVVAE